MKRVLTYGTFDLFHYGHLRLLERAKKLGDYLIVAVSTDSFNAVKGKKCAYPYEHRLKSSRPSNTWTRSFQRNGGSRKRMTSPVTRSTSWSWEMIGKADLTHFQNSAKWCTCRGLPTFPPRRSAGCQGKPLVSADEKSFFTFPRHTPFPSSNPSSGSNETGWTAPFSSRIKSFSPCRLPGRMKKIFRTVQDAASYHPDYVITPGNFVDFRLPGRKVQIFHGIGVEKPSHYKIRHFFDLYCTSGPFVTERFQKAAEQYGYFLVRRNRMAEDGHDTRVSGQGCTETTEHTGFQKSYSLRAHAE